MKELIDLLRREGVYVTIYDRGGDKAEFVLAVGISEPIDIWYLGRMLAFSSDNIAFLPTRAPTVEGDLLVFHDIEVDSTTYEYICAADQDAD